MHSTAAPDDAARSFYRSAIDVLSADGVDFLVGGAYAMRVHAAVERDTKDFDLFVRPRDADRVIRAFRAAGFSAGYAFPHWLLKVQGKEHFLDVIYRAGNGLCDVDEEWFQFAREAEIIGANLRLCPPEEMLWQKAFIMERERFDGADVQHLLRACGHCLDWERLLRRFGEDWPVLLSHLVLFRFVYPSEGESVPPAIIEKLTAQLLRTEPTESRICRGTLLSRLQYLDDVEKWDYEDARIEPRVRMSEAERQRWTQEARDQALLMSLQSPPSCELYSSDLQTGGTRKDVEENRRQPRRGQSNRQENG